MFCFRISPELFVQIEKESVYHTEHSATPKSTHVQSSSTKCTLSSHKMSKNRSTHVQSSSTKCTLSS